MIPERLLVRKQEDFHYPIVFQQNFEKLAQEILDLKKDSARICIVTDSHVAPLYLEQVKEALLKTGMTVSSYVLPAGEANKNLEQIQGIYEQDVYKRQALCQLWSDFHGQLVYWNGSGTECRITKI